MDFDMERERFYKEIEELETKIEDLEQNQMEKQWLFNNFFCRLFKTDVNECFCNPEWCKGEGKEVFQRMLKLLNDLGVAPEELGLLSTFQELCQEEHPREGCAPGGFSLKDFIRELLYHLCSEK